MRASTWILGIVVGPVALAGAGSPDRPPASRPTAPGIVYYVAASGDDANPGTSRRPLASLEGARDAVRRLKQFGPLPAGGVEVRIRGGVYPREATFLLSAEDGGTEAAPVRYRAVRGEVPRFTGAVTLRHFRPVTDPATLARLPEVARVRVREADVREAGVTNLIPFELGGFGSGRGFRTHPAMELYVDGQPMTWARWPNEGFVKTVEVPGPLTLPAWDRRPGTREGRFSYEGDRPGRWIGETDAWLYGYWFWDWADSYEKVESIDLEKREIRLARPWHGYGFRKQQRFLALNLLAELDAPGEWYLDRSTGRLYVWPPGEITRSVVEMSTAAFPMVVMDGVSWLEFEGLVWELGAADGVEIRGGEHCALVGCTIRRLAGQGVNLQGGRRHLLRSCDIHTLGRGGVKVAGGDRRTLSPGGHVVVNCHIHHVARIDRTYTPAVGLDGVGHRVAHNLIHDGASSAMRVEGNDHRIEFNEVHRVVLESDDQGGVDMWGNPTYRGNVFRYNYWHHMGNWERKGAEAPTGQAGVRLDDAISGVLLDRNVFQRCSAGVLGFGGVQIHGGKDNRLEANLFVDCGAAVSFTPWGDKTWRTFVAKSLDDPAIDRELYLKRYPALARLADDHDVNALRGNVALRCGRFLLRAPAGLQLEDNREIPTSDELEEGRDGRLIWTRRGARRLGLESIPFEDIGLHVDRCRKRTKPGWELHPRGR